jgi:hypothetical protein
MPVRSLRSRVFDDQPCIALSLVCQNDPLRLVVRALQTEQRRVRTNPARLAPLTLGADLRGVMEPLVGTSQRLARQAHDLL